MVKETYLGSTLVGGRVVGGLRVGADGDTSTTAVLLTGGADTLSVALGHVGLAALGSAPAHTGSALVDTGTVDHLLAGRAADALAGSGILLLTGRTTDLGVSGRTAVTTKPVAQGLSVGTGGGTVTVTVGSSRTGGSTTLTVDLGGGSRTTRTVLLKGVTVSTGDGLVGT
jgi:hypothetical protein